MNTQPDWRDDRNLKAIAKKTTENSNLQPLGFYSHLPNRLAFTLDMVVPHRSSHSFVS